ncbi:MAB_1171c family putative transporter [Catellatospora sichuanensis]|uniref:MAB_1171c family putative transporter n=1 Tax=Catellatospora sichuanensis TaxID=1969805 RepID=UPI0011830942|nr:MAB_1171c family putative transporter [Catellatospora sichuanensis]
MFARYFSAALLLGVAIAGVDLWRNPSRRSGARVSRMMIVALGAAAMLMLTPGFGYEAIDRLFGVENTARLLSNSTTLAACAAIQIMILYWVMPAPQAGRAALRRGAVLALAVAGMATAFATTPTAQNTGNWQADNTTRLGISIYLAIYFGYLAWTAAQIILLVPRYARRAHLTHIKLGLWCFVAFGWTGMVYNGAGLVTAVADDLGAPRLPGQLVPVYLTGLGLSIVSLILSVVIPILGITWMKSYRAYQCCRLRPFWAALTGAHPEILLETPAKRFAYNIGCIFAREHQALYRRTTEIRDVYLSLRPWMDAQAQSAAEHHADAVGLSGRRRAAAVEAAVVKAALYAKVNGHPTTGTGAVQPGGADMPSEVAWLLRVATEFSGTVAGQVIDQMRHDRGPDTVGAVDDFEQQGRPA